MYGNSIKWGYEEAHAGYIDLGKKNTAEVAFVRFESAHLQMTRT